MIVNYILNEYSIVHDDPERPQGKGGKVEGTIADMESYPNVKRVQAVASIGNTHPKEPSN